MHRIQRINQKGESRSFSAHSSSNSFQGDLFLIVPTVESYAYLRIVV